MIVVHCQVRNCSAIPWNKVDMSLHLEKLSRQANQNSLVFLNVVCLAEIQHIQIVLSLVWPCWRLNPVTYCSWVGHTTGQSKEHETFQIALWIPMSGDDEHLWFQNTVQFTYNEILAILNRLFISINPSSRCRYKMYKVWLSRNDFMSLPTFQINTSDVCSKYTT